MLAERIRRFIERPDDGEFSTLADEATAADGVATSWPELTASAPRLDASPEPELFRAAVSASLPLAAFVGPGRQPILALAGDEESALVAEILALRGAPESVRPIRGRTVEAATVRSWLAARQRSGEPAALVGSEARLDRLLAPLERRGLRFRLPPGSAVVAIRGGESVGPELARRLAESLGLATDRLVAAWETPGVATPFFAPWTESPPFQAPAWTRVESPGGELTVLDLANLGRPLKVTTGIRGEVEGSIFHIAPV